MSFRVYSNPNPDCFDCRSGLDYAFACTLSGPLVKADTRQLDNKPTPRIIESVKQGIQAVKRTPLSQTQRTKLNPSIVDENVNLRRTARQFCQFLERRIME